MTETTLTNLKVKLLEHDKPAYRVAAAVGLHPSVLSDYALGKLEIKGDHLRALCKYFKCTQKSLLGTSTFDYSPYEAKVELSPDDAALLEAAIKRLEEHPSDIDHAGALRDVFEELGDTAKAEISYQAKMSVLYASRRLAVIADEMDNDTGTIQLTADLMRFATTLGPILSAVE